jgi:HD-GYP domain-containing protein (c-di-GMP phosphodiesterase class II)
MVRLIDIIKKNLKKSSVSEDPLTSFSSVSAPVPELKSVQEKSFRKKNQPKPKAAATSSAIPVVTGDALKEVYMSVFYTVKAAVDQVVLKDKIEEAVAKVADVFEGEPYSRMLLMSYSFSQKSYLTAHITNDVVLTVAFASFLGFDREDVIGLGTCALCHDLGMTHFEGISKKGQQLTQQEIEDIKQHPLRSAEIVRPVFAERISSVVMDVHERENGQGYPRGIPGAEIHLWAKIIAVVDTFEALTHPRVFRSVYSPYEAIRNVIKKTDILFDDMVVKRFIDFMSIYPVGSLVNLNSGEVAIVTGSNAASPTRPVVRVILNENREVEEGDNFIDLSGKEFIYITGVVAQDKEKEFLYYLKPLGQVDLDEA